MYVGGHFSGICVRRPHCPALVTRRHLLGLKTSNGDLTAWNPEANSDLGVYVLARTPSWLSVGGDFTVIGGVSQAHYARLPIRFQAASLVAEYLLGHLVSNESGLP